MKINSVFSSCEVCSFFQHPKDNTIFRATTTDIYLYNTKYTQICDFINSEYITDPIGIFINASCKDKLEVLKWFYTTYNLTKRYVTLSFRWASVYGCLRVREWLRSKFNLTKKDNKFALCWDRISMRWLIVNHLCIPTCTVDGTTNKGMYTTLSAAYTAGFRSFKIVGNTTETDIPTNSYILFYIESGVTLTFTNLHCNEPVTFYGY